MESFLSCHVRRRKWVIRLTFQSSIQSYRLLSNVRHMINTYRHINVLVNFCTSYESNEAIYFSLPWIPIEYHTSMQLAASDFKADIFAYATTIWEIFSKGIKPQPQDVS